MNFKILSKLLITGILVNLIIIKVYAQDSLSVKQRANTAPSYISWISQYPVYKDKKTQPNFLKFLVTLVFGKSKKEQPLTRPVAVCAVSPQNFMILDQGSKSIFDVQDKKADIPRCIKKKGDYFSSLVGMCSLPDNEILFTDSRLNKIYRLSANRKKETVLNDSLQLQQPTGIAYSELTKQIWVVETNAHRISILNDKGELVKTIGKRGEDTGQFNFPTSIWIDKSGDAYIVDAMNFRIQIFNSRGEFVTSFGQVGDVSGTFARPKGIATDTYGNIYVVDGLFHVVQMFDRAGNYLYKFGSQGKDKEQFWMPSGIYIDSRNYIYVADSYNSRVQIFHLNNRYENEKKYSD